MPEIVLTCSVGLFEVQNIWSDIEQDLDEFLNHVRLHYAIYNQFLLFANDDDVDHSLNQEFQRAKPNVVRW